MARAKARARARAEVNLHVDVRGVCGGVLADRKVAESRQDQAVA